MGVLGRISRLLALEEPPTVPEALESNAELATFLNSMAVAVESKQEQAVGLERALAEARLRQLNLEQNLKNLQHKRGEQQTEIDQLNEALRGARNQLSSFDQEKSRDSSDRAQALTETEKLRGELDVKVARCERLEREKEDLLRLVDRRQVDIDGLNDQLNKFTAMLRESREALLKKEGELGDAINKTSILNRQVEMHQEEAAKYKKQAEWNTQELETTLNDFANYRRQKAQEIASLQANVETLTIETNRQEEQLALLRGKLEEKDSSLEEYLCKVRDAEAALADRESIFTQEMATRTRLADLYREGMEEARMRLEETERLLEASQNSSSLVDDKLKEIKRETEREIEIIREELVEKDREIALLRGNLDEGGRGETHSGSSSGQIAGRTPSDVYSEYAKTKSELLSAKREINRLKVCIQDICQDIEARVPVLQMERQENERLKADIAALSQQLISVSRQKEELEGRVRRLEGETRELRGSKALLEQQGKDLGHQVQSLLGELEGLPPLEEGGNIFDEEDQVMDANQLIEERLVGFRNIQELQVRNQELLRAIRELSQAQEGEELARLQQAEQEMRTLLDANAAELADLKEQRQKQSTLVESLIRQRDMLREMVSATNDGNGSGLVPTTSPRIDGGGDNSAATIAALEELRAEYEMFRSEKTKSEKYLQDQADALQREAGELRGRLAHLTAQLDFAQERYELLKGNYEMERRELSSLRQSNTNALNSIMQHQAQVQQLVGDVVSSKETQQRLSSQLAALRIELDMTRANERRLQQEAANLQAEKDRLSQLFVGLQSLTNEHESGEGSIRQHLGEQIELLERELQSARLKIVEEVEAHKLAVAVADREYRDLVRRHETLMETTSKVKEELSEAKSNLSDSHRKISDLEQLYRRSEERLAVLMAPSSGGDADQAREVAATRAKLAAVEDELRLEKEHSRNYQEMARSAERNLAELAQTHDEYKTMMEAKLNVLTGTKQELTCKLETLQSHHATLESDSDKAKEQYESELSTLRSQLEQLQEYAQMASSHSTLRKEDVERLQQLVEESRTRYEQEVVAHGRDMELLNSVKLELLQTHKSLTSVEEAFAAARERLAAYEGLLESEKGRVESETAELKGRVSELENQNNILLGQLESFAGKQSRRVSSIGAYDEAEGGPETAADMATADLAQVVKYLRRQKDIIQVEHEAMSIEYRRVKTQAEALQRSLDETRAMLAEEQSGNQWQAQMASEYKTLLDKVEQLNIIRESNSTLRHETDRLTGLMRQMEADLEAAREALGPKEEESRLLRARITASSEEVRLIKEDRDNWKKRFDQVISKYQVDPGEVDSLRAQLETANEKLAMANAELEETRATLEVKLTEKNAQLDEVSAKLTSLKTKHTSLLEKSRNLVEAKKELQAKVQELEAAAAVSGQAGAADSSALEALQNEKNQLVESLAAAEAESSRLKVEIKENADKLAKYSEALKKFTKMKQDFEKLRAAKEELSEELSGKSQEFENYKKEAEMRHSLLTSSHQARVAKLAGEVERLKSGISPEPSVAISPLLVPLKRSGGHLQEEQAPAQKVALETLSFEEGEEQEEEEQEGEGEQEEEPEQEGEGEEEQEDGEENMGDEHDLHDHVVDLAAEEGDNVSLPQDDDKVGEEGEETHEHAEEVDEMMGLEDDELLSDLSPAEDMGEESGIPSLDAEVGATVHSSTTAESSASAQPAQAVQSTPAPTVRSSGVIDLSAKRHIQLPLAVPLKSAAGQPSTSTSGRGGAQRGSFRGRGQPSIRRARWGGGNPPNA